MQLRVLGEDTQASSALCAACPHSAAGCCVAPPRYDWSDLARVLRHGGRDWLLQQLFLGHLLPQPHGLSVLRKKGRARPGAGAPRLRKCVFHNEKIGCILASEQRPATCNFYVCDSVYQAAERAGQAQDVARCKRMHDALVSHFVNEDHRLRKLIDAQWPPEARYSAAFFDWLAVQSDAGAKATLRLP